MTKYITLVLCLVFGLKTQAQTTFDGQEIGAEVYAGFSNLGGAFGVELKHASILNKNFAVGPSIRLQRTWSNNFGQNASINIWGPGVFAHARYRDMVFAGAEFQLLRSPYNFVTFAAEQKKWAPIMLLGGGFCFKLGKHIRLNAAIFYDVINANNSPFRSSYNFSVKNEAGQIVRILPIIYRVTFFFPLGQKKEENKNSELE
jgi:hypothetical protein